MATQEELKAVSWSEVKDLQRYLLAATGLPALDGSYSYNNGWCRSCVVKFKGSDNVKLIIVEMMKDPFHRRNLTSFKYILNNGMKIVAQHINKQDKGVFIS